MFFKKEHCSLGTYLFVIVFFFLGEQGGEEERDIDLLPQACALMGNLTGDLLVHGMTLNH